MNPNDPTPTVPDPFLLRFKLAIGARPDGSLAVLGRASRRKLGRPRPRPRPTRPAGPAIDLRVASSLASVLDTEDRERLLAALRHPDGLPVGGTAPAADVARVLDWAARIKLGHALLALVLRGEAAVTVVGERVELSRPVGPRVMGAAS